MTSSQIWKKSAHAALTITSPSFAKAHLTSVKRSPPTVYIPRFCPTILHHIVVLNASFINVDEPLCAPHARNGVSASQSTNVSLLIGDRVQDVRKPDGFTFPPTASWIAKQNLRIRIRLRNVPDSRL